MGRRLVGVAVAGLAAIGAVVAVIVLTGGSDSRSSDYRGSIPPEGIELPEFTLTDEEGRPVSSDELAGKAVVITFLDTQCEAECPIVAPLVGQGVSLLEESEREEVVAIAISSAGPDDTPERIVEFLDRLRVRGILRYLNAPLDELERVWRAFAVASSYESGIHDLHSIPVRIFDREGAWVATLNSGVDLTPENLAYDLRTALE